MRAPKGFVFAAALAGLLLGGTRSQAALVLSLSGTITSSGNAGGFLPAGIVNGATSYVAVISFDDSAADVNPSPTSGRYALPTLAATITIGGTTTITISPSSPRYPDFPPSGRSASIDNDLPGFLSEDRYQIDYLNANAPNGYTEFETFLLQLTDFRLSGSAGDSPLTSDALAGVVPDPSAFNGGNNLFRYARSEGGVSSSFQGTVTSIELQAVPEPSTILSGGFAALVGLGLAWRRRKAGAAA
jgi:hypothetical protein